MTSTKIFIENYKAITLEIELLKIRKKFVGIELQTLLFDNNQNKAFELNMELDSIDYTIIELEIYFNPPSTAAFIVKLL